MDSQALQKPFSFVELGACMGGFRLAANQFNGRCVFAVETNKIARLHYAQNFEADKLTDNTDFAANVPKHDIAFAHITHENLHKNKDLIAQIESSITQKCQTSALVLMPKILAQKQQKNIAKFCHNLTNAGFYITSKWLSSELYGAVQARDDICIIACKQNIMLDQFCWPKHRLISKTLNDILSSGRVNTDLIVAKCNTTKKLEPQYKTIVRCAAHNRTPVYSSCGIIPKIRAGANCSNGADCLCAIDGVIRKLTTREILNSFGFPTGYRILTEKNISSHTLGQNVFVFLVELLLIEIFKSLHLPIFAFGKSVDYQRIS